jgi:hypothetical protein
LNLKAEPERINQLGDLVTTPAHIFGYCRNLNGKQLASFTLPNNSNMPPSPVQSSLNYPKN